MDYFKILNLDREPFSNSPDPDFFFKSRQHLGCLQSLELSIRLRRGMNIVIGEVGTGKTTLCRQLLRKFADDDSFESHLILDPAFKTAKDFLSTIAEMISGEEFPQGIAERLVKESIKKALFQKGVEKEKNVVLIIDEGQKLPEFCLEILRELLNYETNEYKLLQIVIFGQMEFEQTLSRHANFADRINMRYTLNPMSFRDTREMIRFRLRQSSTVAKPASLFTYPATWAVYRASKGYPRKIINLCHQSMLAMIIQNRTKAGWHLVRSCVNRAISTAASRSARYSKTLIFFGLAVLVLAAIIPTRISNNTHQAVPIRELLPLPDYHLDEIRILPAVEQEQVRSGSPSPVDEGDRIGTTQLQADDLMPTVVFAEVTNTPGKHTKSRIETVAPPSVMGAVTVEAKDTLGDLIRHVYGTYQRTYVDAVLSVNPQILNPNQVQRGDIVVFPVIPVKLSQSTIPRWWIQIDKTSTLRKAIQTMKANKKRLPPTLCIPSWSGDTGLEFTIILRDHFFSIERARDRLEQTVPLIGKEHARLISGWNEGKIYFADPFRGQGH